MRFLMDLRRKLGDLWWVLGGKYVIWGSFTVDIR
jgi:hypothetical protein